MNSNMEVRIWLRFGCLTRKELRSNKWLKIGSMGKWDTEGNLIPLQRQLRYVNDNSGIIFNLDQYNFNENYFLKCLSHYISYFSLTWSICETMMISWIHYTSIRKTLLPCKYYCAKSGPQPNCTKGICEIHCNSVETRYYL